MAEKSAQRYRTRIYDKRTDTYIPFYGKTKAEANRKAEKAKMSLKRASTSRQEMILLKNGQTNGWNNRNLKSANRNTGTGRGE